MSYQVLARKWRPKSFATLVGQEHVVRALSHALATGRLHHAWLFTGTRGVGKTTISRILAKALNCEGGITAEPCGICSACTAIDGDRFPDYVEMDAASNRGVDDMASLLDKAVYAPTQGRYKVYMIDEVHMLTGHAFNAMLKTLEEPPEHVKFILATTDPQKIPVTVLSRCLQFNLKQMPAASIVEHLAGILEAEEVAFERPALAHLAKAASGSMRDALSLLDQAIAHGAGSVEQEPVAQMLGTVGDDHLFGVLDALVSGDIAAMLAVADDMASRSLSFDAAMQSLASLLHRVALMQFAPAAVSDEAERSRLAPFAEALDAEFLQLAYQIVIHGRDELSLAPDEHAGFTMSLLRLHAFRPEQGAASAPRSPARSGEGGGGVPAPTAHAQGAAPGPGGAPATLAAKDASAQILVAREPVALAREEAAAPARSEASQDPARAAMLPPWEDLPVEAHASEHAYADAAPAPEPAGATAAVQVALRGRDWHGLQRALKPGGLVRELCQHCEWAGLEDDTLSLRLSSAHAHLLDVNPGLPARLEELLRDSGAPALRIRVVRGDIAGETPAQRDAQERQQRHVAAVAALERDPFVCEIIERFDATLVEASVRPI